MPSRETSRQRTSRIPLDYYKRADAFSRWKVGLSLIASVCAALWLSGLGWDVRAWPLRAQRSRLLATHGTLSRAHAMWDAECAACHVPFTPIDASGSTARFLGSARASETRCLACHAASPHHASVVAAGEENACASCHADHRGRDASLVSMDDSECTRCHAALASHLKPGASPSIEPRVSRFDTAHHPEFELLRRRPPRDPGTVNFNHALHLAKGLTLVPNGLPLKRVIDIRESDRDFYRTRGHADSEGIQLRCDSCHVPDGGPRLPRSERARQGNGAYMLPIRYETQCRACHPLDYDPGLPVIPHGLQPPEMEAALWQIYAGRFIAGKPGLMGGRPAPYPVPGRAEAPEVLAAREAIGADVAKAKRVLLGEKKCGECHTIDAPAGRGVRIPKAGIPEVWFARAAFDHSAHRGLNDCRACHDRANTSQTSADVLLPSVTRCFECHAPRREDATTIRGGAEFACTECHRYHDGASLAGPRGASSLDSSADATIRRFLLGSPPASGPK